MVLALAFPVIHSASAHQIFEFSVEKAGQVSAAVYDSDGRLLRELLRGRWSESGTHTLTWDGLDRSGQSLPPGEYEWRTLRKPKFRAEYVTSLGTNPDSRPYHQWVGSHGGAASIAVDGTGMYVAAEVTETAPVLLNQSLDGRKRYWTASRGGDT